MQFNPSELNENYDIRRLVSESGRWEIGYRQMIFGVRVSLSEVGSDFITLDYCGGADMQFVQTLMTVLLAILKPIPEDINPDALSKRFPVQNVKPVYNDLNCWPELLKLAAAGLEGTV